MNAPNLLITASAGTGKTYRLTNRYLHLLHAGSDPAHILATTFTRKAAGEILERILLRIAQAAVDPKARKELAFALEEPSLSQATCYRMLMQVIHNLHRLSIGTLDSFFGKVGQCYSFELGLPTGWEIVDEVRGARLRAEAIEALLGQSDKSDLLELLYLLNRGEARRSVAEQIHLTVENLYSLYRETTPEAWKAIPRSRPLDDESLETLLEDLRECPLPTHKSIAKARDKEYQYALAGDWASFIKAGIAAVAAEGGNLYFKKEIPEVTLAIYDRLIQHAKGVLVGRLADQTEATRKLLEHYETVYLRLQQQRRQLRFDDITHALSLAANAGEQPGTFRLGSNLHHLLLDEFQDTSASQWQALRPLAQQITSKKGESFFCVGDTKQAIYGWRGGCAEIFDALPDELESLALEPLDKSYRSAPPIIEVVNAIFQNIDKHHNLGDATAAVSRWAASFPPHSTAKNEMKGYATLQTAPAAEEGESQSETTLQFAAEEVVRLAKASPQLSIGVLVSKNNTVADIMNRLRKLRLPASEEGGTPLTDSAAARLILSLIRLSDHPGDTIARYHLAHSPLAEEAGITDWANDSAARACSQRIRSQLLHKGYGETIESWARLLMKACNRREKGRLLQLIEKGYAYQPRATLRGDDFIDLIEKERVSDPTSAPIRVMTIHQAKGLEFDIVILPELSGLLIGQPPDVVIDRPSPTLPLEKVCRYAAKELLPLLPLSIQKMHSEYRTRKVSESLCCTYVAITRAAHALHMIIPPSSSSTKKESMPRTTAGLLRAALVGTEKVGPGELLYEVGDAAWSETRERAEEGSASPLAEDLPHKEEKPITLAPAKESPHRGRVRSTPSSLEGGGRTNLRDLLSHDQSEAAARGTLLHAWFEKITWLDEGAPDAQQLRAIGADLLAPPAWIEEALVDFFHCLQQPNFQHLLSKKAYPEGEAEAWTEYEFLDASGEGLLRGSIDRLVLIRQQGKLVAADIIDFKSDKIYGDAEAWHRNKVEYYQPQLEAYRQAVAPMFQLPLEKITARIAFVASDTLIEIAREVKN